MKKRFLLLGVMVLMVFVALSGCNKDKRFINNALDDLQIEFAEGESFTTVTQNLTLPQSYGDDIIVSWESSDETTITPHGVVVQKQTDTTVILTATISYNDQVATREFEIIALKYESLLDSQGNEITDTTLLFFEIRNRLEENFLEGYLTDTIIHTPFEMYGATISWVSDNDFVSAYHPGLTKVIVPSWLEFASLTATITKDNETATATFAFFIDYGPMIPLEFLEKLGNFHNSSFRTSGIIQSYIALPHSFNFFLSDGTSTIVLTAHCDEVISSVIENVGNEVEVHHSHFALFKVILINDSPITTEPLDLIIVDSKESFPLQIFQQSVITNLLLLSISSVSEGILFEFENSELDIFVSLYVRDAEQLTPEQLTTILALQVGDSFQVTSNFISFDSQVFSTYIDSTIIEKLDLTNQELLDISVNELSIAEQIINQEYIHLPVATSNGAVVSWTSSDDLIINPSTGQVQLPLNTTITVILTATLKLGGYERTVDFTVIVGTPLTPINNLHPHFSTEVKVRGIITSGDFSHPSIWWQMPIFIIQDSISAIFILTEDSTTIDSLRNNIGNEVEIIGAMRGEFLGVSSITVIDEDIPMLEHTNTDFLDLNDPSVFDYHGVLVEFTDLYVLRADTTYWETFKRTTFHFINLNNGDLITAVWDTGAALDDSIIQTLENVTEGDFYTIRSALFISPHHRGNRVSLLLSNETIIEKGVASSEALSAARLWRLEKSASELRNYVPFGIYHYNSALALPITCIFGTSITWESSDNSVIDPNGTPIVTFPEQGTSIVVLTATLTFEGEELTISFFVLVHS